MWTNTFGGCVSLFWIKVVIENISGSQIPTTEVKGAIKDIKIIFPLWYIRLYIVQVLNGERIKIHQDLKNQSRKTETFKECYIVMIIKWHTK